MVFLGQFVSSLIVVGFSLLLIGGSLRAFLVGNIDGGMFFVEGFAGLVLFVVGTVSLVKSLWRR